MEDKKKEQYNPFVTRTVKRAQVGRVKCYLRAIKPNPIDKFGNDLRNFWWTHFDTSLVYYYEVGANDGSYRKCATREQAEQAFANLVKFEKRQTEIV